MVVNLGFALLLTFLAGLSTGVGSIIAFFTGRLSQSYLSFLLGLAGGVMVYISFTELLGTAISDVGFLRANIAFFAGIAVFAVVDILVPHSYEEESADRHAATARAEDGGKNGSGLLSAASMKRGGVMIALGIAIHNFPEGMITFASAASGNTSLGILIAVAVAVHNIPEGIAVSAPILYATGSRRQAFAFSFLSGLAEPVGALIGYVLLLPFLTPALLSATLAFVAGIMVYISFDEILPLAHRYGREHLVILGVVGGMAVMALSLWLLA
jgi:ZIP family zinc transporter